jgi:hypothetical protein
MLVHLTFIQSLCFAGSSVEVAHFTFSRLVWPFSGVLLERKLELLELRLGLLELVGQRVQLRLVRQKLLQLKTS